MSGAPVKVSNFVGGQWVGAASGRSYQRENPARSDEVVLTAPDSDPTDVTQAVEHVAAGYHEWAAKAPEARADVILRAADVSYEPIIEARGWPLTLRLVELGMGIAIVNDFCSLPRGVISKPMRGLPRQTYRAMRRASARHSKAAAALFDALAARRTRT